MKTNQSELARLEAYYRDVQLERQRLERAALAKFKEEAMLATKIESLRERIRENDH